MKTLLTLIITCMIYSLSAQGDITAAEYFIDADPGVGNGTVITVSPGLEFATNFNFSSEGLSEGRHDVHVRVKDSNDKWSHYTSESFIITNYTQQAEITQAEFFVDADPGIGNGTPLSINPDHSIDESFSFDSADLEEGVHFVKFRAKNSDDNWGVAVKKMFLVTDYPVDVPILEAEYWFDLDPGMGNGTSIPITSGMIIDESFAVPIPENFEAGFHLLHIRVKDEDNSWSHYARMEFEFTGVVNIYEEDLKLSFYPNPAQEFITFESDSKIQNLTIIDSNGKLVLEILNPDKRLDISHLTPGVYVLRLRIGDTVTQKRLVKS